MKIALISPPWVLKNDYQPLGLGYLAALLEARGHQARLYDFTLRKNKDYSVLAEEVLRPGPGVVGVTVTTNTHTSSLKLVLAIKRIDSSARIVVGGPHPSLFPEEMVKEPGIDFVVFGEGEYTLLELVEQIAASGGDDFSSIKGLAWRAPDNTIVKNQIRPAESNLDRFPLPVRSVVGSAGYPYHHTSSGRRLATILSSRGCPFNCSYCYKGIFGTTYRQRSVDNIILEIKRLIEEYGITFFYFIDDLFIFDHERIREFCRRVTQENIQIEWQCLGRVDLVTLEILKVMRTAGCVQVFYGIESGNPEIIRKTKNVTLDQVRSAVRWAKDVGIRVFGYFMIGLPGDTTETMRQTLDFSSELDLEEAMFSIATPFPGTALWEKMFPENKAAVPADFDVLFYHGNPRKVLFNISSASEKELLSMYRRARQLSSRISARHILTRRFGRRLGGLFFMFSTIPFVRAAGKAVYNRVFSRTQGRIKPS